MARHNRNTRRPNRSQRRRRGSKNQPHAGTKPTPGAGQRLELDTPTTPTSRRKGR